MRIQESAENYLETFSCILENMECGMTEAQLNDSITHNFIVQMIPHHQAAIEMSENILKYTTNIPLQDIAECIIEEQTRSIENMEEILCSCGDVQNCEQQVCMYQERMNQIMQNMFCRMGNVQAVNNINANFIREMIPHHLGAVEMSELTLCYDIDPQLVPILESIIASQKRGIMQMQRLLRMIGSGRMC